MSTEPKQRLRHRLGPDERDGLWECNGPARWRAFYAWTGSEGWAYKTRDYDWQITTAGVDDVWGGTITSSKTLGSERHQKLFEFRELARRGDGFHTYVFTQNGDAVLFPCRP